MYSHNRNVKSLVLFWSCNAWQGDGLLQLLHDRPVVGSAQSGLGPEAPLQCQTEGALTQVALTVLQRLWRRTRVGLILCSEWTEFRIFRRISRLGWETISSTSSGLLCKIAAALVNVTPSKLILFREMRRPPAKKGEKIRVHFSHFAMISYRNMSLSVTDSGACTRFDVAVSICRAIGNDGGDENPEVQFTRVVLPNYNKAWKANGSLFLRKDNTHHQLYEACHLIILTKAQFLIFPQCHTHNLSLWWTPSWCIKGTCCFDMGERSTDA